MIERSNVLVHPRAVLLERAVQYRRVEMIPLLAQWLSQQERGLDFVCEAVKKAIANYRLFALYSEEEGQEKIQNDQTLTLLFNWVSWKDLSVKLSKQDMDFIYPLYEKWDTLHQQKQLTATLEPYLCNKKIAKRKI